MDAQKNELFATPTPLSGITETDQDETLKFDRPSTASGKGLHTGQAEAKNEDVDTTEIKLRNRTPQLREKIATKKSKPTDRTTKSSGIVEKRPGQPTKSIMAMSTCELKACLRARKLSALGKKSTLRDRLLADIPKLNPSRKELMESTKLKHEIDSLEARILSLEQDCQELRKRDEQHRKLYEDMNGKFANRIRGNQEALEEYFFSMVGMSAILDLPLDQTCCTIIAGLHNNECSSTLAGVGFASTGELYERLKIFEAPRPSTVANVRQRHRHQKRFNRCFRCSNRHPLFQQCWQFNERYEY